MADKIVEQIEVIEQINELVAFVALVDFADLAALVDLVDLAVWVGISALIHLVDLVALLELMYARSSSCPDLLSSENPPCPLLKRVGKEDAPLSWDDADDTSPVQNYICLLLDRDPLLWDCVHLLLDSDPLLQEKCLWSFASLREVDISSYR
ncbi:MAG: hypothetical protein AB1847_00755 [bacterium]